MISIPYFLVVVLLFFSALRYSLWQWLMAALDKIENMALNLRWWLRSFLTSTASLVGDYFYCYHELNVQFREMLWGESRCWSLLRIYLCCLFFQVDSLTVESMAKTADMSVTEFADQTSRALTGQTTSQDNFVFQAKPKETKLQVG